MPGLGQNSDVATNDLWTWAYHSATLLCKTGVTGLEKAAMRVRDQGWGVWNMAGTGEGLSSLGNLKTSAAQVLPTWPTLF